MNAPKFNWYSKYREFTQKPNLWKSTAKRECFEFKRSFIYDGETYKVCALLYRNYLIPQVFLVNKPELHNLDYHIFSKGQICLGVQLDLLNAWKEYDFSIDYFLNQIVQGYLETLHYYVSYGEWLYGDWEHDQGGVTQYLKENNMTIDEYNNALQQNLRDITKRNQPS